VNIGSFQIALNVGIFLLFVNFGVKLGVNFVVVAVFRLYSLFMLTSASTGLP